MSLKKVDARSIEERPKEILDRNEYGHWEMDTVVGGKGKSKDCLLVMTERMTRREYIKKIPDKSTKSVSNALNDYEHFMGYKKFTETFKTITCDNGCEFSGTVGIEKSCLKDNENRTTLYYCHPYSSYERGSNENANKLIRRFIPKGSDIGAYTDEQISYIQNWVNNYPRKILNYLSSELYCDKLSIE